MKMIKTLLPIVLMLSLSAGCQNPTLQHYGRVAIIEGHEALDAALGAGSSNAPSSKSSLTNLVPVIVKPSTPVGSSCGCDLSRPLATPLVPKHGANDGAVDKWLRERWASGIADNCGGLPGDVRPQLMRTTGKCFNYKYVAMQRDGSGIQIRINGGKMTLTDGPFEGQRFHLIGTSAHEAPANGAHPSTLEDWIPAKSGEETAKKQFPYFECRDDL